MRRDLILTSGSPSLARAIRPWAAPILAALAMVLGALLAAPSARAAAANPTETYVQQNVDKGYVILNSTTLSDQDRRAQFRAFMLGLTDIKRIGMFTLGRYANGAPPADVDAFVNAFTDYAIAVYETRLSKYKGQTLKVTGSTARAADDVIVNCDVINPGNPNAPVIKTAFRVRKTADGRNIVTDIQVEGIWLAISQQSDFSGFLQQHNGKIADLTADLIRQTQQIRANG